MRDPLSIASSVTGLLIVAAKILTTIDEFVSDLIEAPESARKVVVVVEEMRFVLTSIQQLISDGLMQDSEERRKMIHVKSLMVIFRESIIAFSELEAIVCNPIQSKWDRVEWRIQESKVLQALKRLEAQKTSFATMLGILQCDSMLVAQRCLTTLQETVNKLLQDKQELRLHLERADYGLLEGASTRLQEDDQSTLRPAESMVAETIHADIPLVAAEDYHIATLEAEFRREFEITLEQTRVYRRVQLNGCDNSFATSMIRTHAWTMLSDLSLNDISVVSVVALPVTIEEMLVIGSSLTITRMMLDAESSSSADQPQNKQSEPVHSDQTMMTRDAPPDTSVLSPEWVESDSKVEEFESDERTIDNLAGHSVFVEPDSTNEAFLAKLYGMAFDRHRTNPGVAKRAQNANDGGENDSIRSSFDETAIQNPTDGLDSHDLRLWMEWADEQERKISLKGFNDVSRTVVDGDGEQKTGRAPQPHSSAIRIKQLISRKWGPSEGFSPSRVISGGPGDTKFIILMLHDRTQPLVLGRSQAHREVCGHFGLSDLRKWMD